MATSQSPTLDASAKPYVRKGRVTPPPPELYMGPPAAALPPAGFYYPQPVLVAPPAPGYRPVAPLGCGGFPQPQAPCVGLPGVLPSPGWAPLAMGVPTPPAGMQQGARQPQLPAATVTPRDGGRGRPSHGVRAGHAPRARSLLRLDVPPRMMPRAAGRAAPPSSRGAAKVEPANDRPSPRSVLVHTSPPDTPPALPSSFPYPELGSPAPRASEGSPSSVPVPAAGSKQPPPRRRRLERAPRFRQAAGVTVRGGDPKPRRLFDPSSRSTTLMIRNIPNDFRRTRLMQILDQHCSIENAEISSGGVKSEYDFLYLPIDFSTGANKGYAFVNLTTPEAARRLHDYLHGHRWRVNGSGKTCEVDHGDIEGREKLVKHFSDSRFDCGNEEFLPVWFEPARDGTRRTLPHLVGRMLRRW